MNITKIPWVANPDGSTLGMTWNPLTGCFGPGGTPEKPNRCPYCFAWGLARGRLRDRYLANTNVIAGDPADPFAPRWWRQRIADLPLDGKPKGVFLCDMGDLFGDWVPKRLIEIILLEVRRHSTWRFYVLTKNPQRLAEFNPWPPDVWVGVSATNQEQYETAIFYLTQVEAKVKFLSLEPLLGAIKLDIV